MEGGLRGENPADQTLFANSITLFEVILPVAGCQRVAGEIKKSQNFSPEAKELRAGAVTRPIKSDRDGTFNPPRALGHDDNAVAHVDRFVDVVGDEEHGGAARLPEMKHFILHPHTSKSVERAKRFVEQEHFRIIDQRPRQGDTLGHSAGKLVRKSAGKPIEAYEVHELFHLMPLTVQDAARDETGLDVATNSEPRKKIRILKDKTAFRVGTGDWLRADQELAGVRNIETGDETKKRRFSATTRAHQRNQFPGRERQRNGVQGQSPGERIVRDRKTLAHFMNAQRGRFRCSDGYHLIIPFCHANTRSRTLKRTVMMVEKKAAIMTRAA